MDTCSKCNFKISQQTPRSNTYLCPIHAYIYFPDKRETLFDQLKRTLKNICRLKKIYVISPHFIKPALKFLENQYDLSIEGQSLDIKSIVITNDNKYAFTMDATSFRVWDLELQRLVKGPKCLYLMLGPCIITRDGRYLAYSSFQDGLMHLVDIICKQTECTISGHTDRILDLVFTIDNCYIITGSLDTSVRIWDIPHRRQEAVLNGHASSVNSVAVTWDNTFIISGSSDATIRVWSFSEKIQYFILYDTHPINKVEVSRDSTFVVYKSHYNLVKLWNIGGNTLLVDSNVYIFTITNDNNYVIIASTSGSIIFWNIQQKRAERWLDSINNLAVQCMAIGNDDKYLLCQYSDHSLALWKIDVHSEEFVFDLHSDDVTSISITRDCRYVVSGSNDDTVRVWSTEDKRQKSIIKIHDTEIFSVGITDSYIVVGLINGLTLVWRLLRT